jgi:exodeoxyribonuclease VII large subunit
MHTYSLTELCNRIQQVVDNGLSEHYWVRAEIASISERTHCYMELIEKADNGILAAK